MTSETPRRQRALEMTAGMIGPNSYADAAQKWWHSELGIRVPKGWAAPAANEPGVMLRLQERRRPWAAANMPTWSRTPWARWATC